MGKSMLHLIRPSACKDTVALEKWLLEQAITGNLLGTAVCFRLAHSRDEILFTGAYKAHPDSAITAAARMYWAASHAADWPMSRR
jgi:hypothetical protein